MRCDVSEKTRLVVVEGLEVRVIGNLRGRDEDGNYHGAGKGGNRRGKAVEIVQAQTLSYHGLASTNFWWS